jgi:hypothetical protein
LLTGRGFSAQGSITFRKQRWMVMTRFIRVLQMLNSHFAHRDEKILSPAQRPCQSSVLLRDEKVKSFLSFRLARNRSSEGLPTSGSDRLKGSCMGHIYVGSRASVVQHKSHYTETPERILPDGKLRGQIYRHSRGSNRESIFFKA